MGLKQIIYVMREKTLLEEFMEISPDATSAIVQGIDMQVIDEKQAQTMLDADPDGNVTHECTLSNGRFIFEMEDGKLNSLFKVTC